MSTDLEQRLAALLPAATVTTAHAVTTADVPREDWVAAVTALRDAGWDFFDLLAVVDQLPGGFDVAVRLWSVAGRVGVHVRTTCPRDDARVPTLTGVFAGAAWHERQGAEMFGVAFDGHPDPRPLLLDPAGTPTPLRKDAPLVRRLEKEWPGAEDPAYRGEGGRPPRRRLQPPGAPG